MIKPPWLKVKVSLNENFVFTKNLLLDLGLHTVCEHAHCPNAVECWNARTATFLILGDRCSRNCNFCAIAHNPQDPPESDEPKKVSKAVQMMNLAYVVITSATRDDLIDGGADHYARTLGSIRDDSPHVLLEVLVPDFGGSEKAVDPKNAITFGTPLT
jgi:lipoic acid synthetase